MDDIDLEKLVRNYQDAYNSVSNDNMSLAKDLMHHQLTYKILRKEISDLVELLEQCDDLVFSLSLHGIKKTEIKDVRKRIAEFRARYPIS
jgi:hypothetical protein